MRDRPAPEAWAARCPNLKRKGSELVGPCPTCGGRDRFAVQLKPPHLFNCRGCQDGTTILKVVFGDTPRSAPTRTDLRKRQYEAERAEKRRIEAVSQATRMIADATQDTHPYLEAKGFSERRGLVYDELLVIPIRHVRSGELLSVQTITADGEKKYLYGGTVALGAHRMGPRNGRRWFVEGYATGLSVQAALKYLSRQDEVVVCFSAGNLKKIARRGFIAADNDASGTGEKAAKATGCPYWMPFDVDTDANDYHAMYGLPALAEGLRSLIQR